jgi:acyl carrier protein
MKLIQQAIKNVFPDADTNILTEETKLAEIPGWDSMNAVNLVVEIELLSGCQNLGLQFDDEVTIGQIIKMLRPKGVNV